MSDADQRISSMPLQSIFNRATRLDPEERYQTVNELKSDVLCYLKQHPVSAVKLKRTALWRYKATLFLKRYKLAASVTIASIIAVVGFVATVMVQNDRIERADSIMRQEIATANRVIEFLTEIFKTSDPIESLGNKVTAREILDNAAIQIKVELSSEPDIQAKLMQVLGSVYLSLGILSQAEPLINNSYRIKQTLYGAEHESLIDSYVELANINELKGNIEQQEDYIRKAIHLAEILPGVNPLVVAENKNRLAVIIGNKAQDFNASLQLLNEALAVQTQFLANHSPEIIDTKRNRIRFYLNQGKFTLAEELAEELYNIALENYSSPHPIIADSLHEWAYVMRWYGNFDKAEKLIKQALDMDISIFGERHHVVLNDYYILASIYEEKFKDAEALVLFEKNIEMGMDILSDGHPFLADNYNSLWTLYRRRGEFELSESYYLKALGINKNLFGEVHYDVAGNYSNLGVLYFNTGKYEKARAALLKAYSIDTEIYGEVHFHVANSLNLLGIFFSTTGNYDKAEKYARKALSVREALYGEEHALTANSRTVLAGILMHKADYGSAEELLNQALKALRNIDDPFYLSEALRVLGKLQLNINNATKALLYFQEAIPILREIHPPDNNSIVEAVYGMAEALILTGQTDQAMNTLSESIKEIERVHGQDSEHYKKFKTLYLSIQ